MTIFVGIDPGVSGAIAAIGPGGVQVADIPTQELPGNGRTQRTVHGYALAVLLRKMVPAEEAAIVVLEDVHAMPSKVSGSGANTSLMHSKGSIEAVLSVLRMDARLVNTQRWKRHYGLDADKAKALTLARTLYPAIAASHLSRMKDDGRADAVLMAHYGKAKFA
jgi:crossover junction endodeoxyribonuclease RuvC